MNQLIPARASGLSSAFFRMLGTWRFPTKAGWAGMAAAAP
jgi:hypothetical protein